MLSVVVVTGTMAGRGMAAQPCIGDCNGDDEVTIDEIIKIVNIALGTLSLHECAVADANGNGEVTIDEILRAVNHALSGCGVSPPGATAHLVVQVDNPSDTSREVCLSGTLANGGQRGAASEYGCAPGQPPASGCTAQCKTVPAGCNGCSAGRFEVGNLAPGEWLHRVRVSATNQLQARRSLLVADPARPNRVQWTVFKNVRVVTLRDDSGTGSLRAALSDANNPDAASRPWLIRFDHAQFGGTLTIELTGDAQLAITAPDTVIDGTNIEGHPSPLAKFRERVYPTIIHQNPASKDRAHAARFLVQAPRVRFIGLFIRRTLGTDTVVDQDLITFGFADARDGAVNTCRLDGGAAARTNENAGTGKDCIDAENTSTTSFSDAVVVENSELRHCYDRAAKSKNGHLVLRDNWIHHNIRGGALAQSGGRLKTERNLIEYNGWNCPNGTSPTFSGDPTNCGGVIVRSAAAQLAAESAAELQTDGDVLRNGATRGIFMQENSLGQVKDVYICGMGTDTWRGNGLEFNSHAGSVENPITIRGTSSVLNTGRGVQLHGDAGVTANVNFGSGADTDKGNNAFTQNSNRNFRLDASSTTKLAQGNQWERCGNTAACDITAIGREDVTAITPGTVSFDPAQAHRNPGSLTITTGGVSPAKVAARGAIVHITGTGFNAIEGYNAYAPGTNGCPAGGGTCPAATDCATLKVGNTCNPVKGTCVEFRDPATQQWMAAEDILAVTPTRLVVTAPFTCSVPTTIRIRRLGVDEEGRVVVVEFPTPDEDGNLVKNFCLSRAM